MYLSFACISFSDLSRRVNNSGTVSSLFIFGLFFIFLADIPKRRDETVSAKLLGWGEHVTIKLVLELPPKDYCNTLVSLLYL